MKIYVYQVDDFNYGAGFVKSVCEAQGRIVEEWEINSIDDARYVSSHGTRHGNARQRVSELAEFAKSMIYEAEGIAHPIIVTNEEWDIAINQALEKEREHCHETVLMAKDMVLQDIRSMGFWKRLKFLLTKRIHYATDRID